MAASAQVLTLARRAGWLGVAWLVASMAYSSASAAVSLVASRGEWWVASQAAELSALAIRPAAPRNEPAARDARYLWRYCSRHRRTCLANLTATRPRSAMRR